MRSLLSAALCIALIPYALADPSPPQPFDPEQVDSGISSDIVLPEELTAATFDGIVSKGLTFIEFYSPYCSHCKELAPVWKKTYQEFHDELKDLKIEMRQVNCVESGDLCSREDITFYPNLRLYVPKKSDNPDAAPKGQHVDTFPRLARIPENIKKYLKSSVAEYNSGTIDMKSSSQLLTNSQFLNIIAGEMDEPTFVSLWPSTNLQYKSSDESNTDRFDRCPDCLALKRTWDKLSNKILITVKTAHFNCRTNKKICETLGFVDLTKPNRMGSDPSFLMFLPKSAGIIRFDYKGQYELNAMKDFALKLADNYKYESLNSLSIGDFMDFKESLNQEDFQNDYESSNKHKTSFVYFYDKETVSDEDFDILPYILETVTSSPFDVHLYKSSDQRLEKLIESQEKNLLDFIHYNKSETKLEYDYDMYLTTRITAKPTILCFKDGSLISRTFQNFAPDEIRSASKVNNWINKNSYPLIGELYPEIFTQYFNQKDKSSDKVLVTFIDSRNSEQTNQILYNLTLAVHEYDHSKKQFFYNQIVDRRNEKDKNVANLKLKNADSIKVLNEMRKEVPHDFNNNEILFTYVDLSKYPEVVKANGWDSSQTAFEVGDSLLIYKSGKFYYDEDESNNKIRSYPYALKKILLYSLSPSLVNFTLTPKLAHSPFSETFRVMDNIHKHGFKGYFFSFLMIYALYIAWSKLVYKKRISRQETGLGILGNIPKSD